MLGQLILGVAMVALFHGDSRTPVVVLNISCLSPMLRSRFLNLQTYAAKAKSESRHLTHHAHFPLLCRHESLELA